MKKHGFATKAALLLTAIVLTVAAGCSTAAPSSTKGNSRGLNKQNGQSQATAAATAGAAYEAPISISEDSKANGEGLSANGEGLSASDDGLRYCDNYKPDTSGEEYGDVDEIGFRSPVRLPLSTFSADPDGAAYSNVRRLISDGSPVPKDAVRIEELINYFHYDYPQPQGDAPFSVTTEYSGCPWDSGHKLLLVGLQGADAHPKELPPSNLVFLLDVSGSMDEYNKLPLVKRAFRMLADRLGENDTVSIVTYASGVDVVLHGVNGGKKARLMRAIEDLEAGGSTAGASGLQTAYDVAWDNFIEGGNNRVILATDGDFNVGPSSDGAMVRLIENKRKSGVFLSVLGFGMGNLKDSKLEGMARNGNGNYAYIDGIQEARKVMVQETGGTLLTIAKDVKIQVEFNPAQVKGYRLIGYENNMLSDEDFSNDKVDAGEIGAGHRVTALYEIIPADSTEEVSGSELKYQTTGYSSSGEICTVNIQYKHPDGTKSSLISCPVNGSIYTAEPSKNFLFASSVAEFGLLLRDSKYRGDASYRSVLHRAERSADDDLKEEFLELVDMADDYD